MAAGTISRTTVQTTPTGQLVQDYRAVLLQLGADRSDAEAAAQADVAEEEILRRMAW